MGQRPERCATVTVAGRSWCPGAPYPGRSTCATAPGATPASPGSTPPPPPPAPAPRAPAAVGAGRANRPPGLVLAPEPRPRHDRECLLPQRMDALDDRPRIRPGVLERPVDVVEDRQEGRGDLLPLGLPFPLQLPRVPLGEVVQVGEGPPPAVLQLGHVRALGGGAGGPHRRLHLVPGRRTGDSRVLRHRRPGVGRRTGACARRRERPVLGHRWGQPRSNSASMTSSSESAAPPPVRAPAVAVSPPPGCAAMSPARTCWSSSVRARTRSTGAWSCTA